MSERAFLHKVAAELQTLILELEVHWRKCPVIKNPDASAIQLSLSNDRILNRLQHISELLNSERNRVKYLENHSHRRSTDHIPNPNPIPNPPA